MINAKRWIYDGRCALREGLKSAPGSRRRPPSAWSRARAQAPDEDCA
jgi:hypothetical protein